ncbi:hypothetical protein FLL66_13975 [Vibrio cholerae]|uniref:hypothetical protein n=1 Tax=Vibrio cholerae TaxID=666 RepID=UPI001159EF3A|nr:hypothetical protein [Vibrio cholerae]TQQ28736.1 hypothetical protein FLL66_13975 [Vibrio cholerae]
MIEENKDNLIRLKEKLNALEPQSDDLKPLFELQCDILKCILEQEDKIKETKTKFKETKAYLRKARLSKNDAKIVKGKMGELEEEIKDRQKLAYIYRCIGDGIVFKFISKWNLKRFFYEVDSPDVKSDAGSLGNKDGLKNELGLVYDAIEHDVPAVLNDLTNVIRHGDVCLLGADDPHVIEVKSSQNKNKRVERQISAINKIHDYLSNDIADIAGVEDMRRVELSAEEVHFNDVINELIENSSAQSLARVSPEEGIFYAAIDVNLEEKTDYDEIFKSVEKPMGFMLNTFKNDLLWDNYYPFALSIQSPESFYRFVNGEVFIIVMIDLAVMERKARQVGLDTELVFDGSMALLFSKELVGFDEPLRFVISEHYFGRLGFEFLSLDWFFKELEPKIPLMEEHTLKQLEQLKADES